MKIRRQVAKAIRAWEESAWRGEMEWLENTTFISAVCFQPPTTTNTHPRAWDRIPVPRATSHHGDQKIYKRVGPNPCVDIKYIAVVGELDCQSHDPRKRARTTRYMGAWGNACFEKRDATDTNGRLDLDRARLYVKRAYQTIAKENREVLRNAPRSRLSTFPPAQLNWVPRKRHNTRWPINPPKMDAPFIAELQPLITFELPLGQIDEPAFWEQQNLSDLSQPQPQPDPQQLNLQQMQKRPTRLSQRPSLFTIREDVSEASDFPVPTPGRKYRPICSSPQKGRSAVSENYKTPTKVASSPLKNFTITATPSKIIVEGLNQVNESIEAIEAEATPGSPTKPRPTNNETLAPVEVTNLQATFHTPSSPLSSRSTASYAPVFDQPTPKRPSEPEHEIKRRVSLDNARRSDRRLDAKASKRVHNWIANTTATNRRHSGIPGINEQTRSSNRRHTLDVDVGRNLDIFGQTASRQVEDDVSVASEVTAPSYEETTQQKGAQREIPSEKIVPQDDDPRLATEQEPVDTTDETLLIIQEITPAIDATADKKNTPIVWDPLGKIDEDIRGVADMEIIPAREDGILSVKDEDGDSILSDEGISLVVEEAVTQQAEDMRDSMMLEEERISQQITADVSCKVEMNISEDNGIVMESTLDQVEPWSKDPVSVRKEAVAGQVEDPIIQQASEDSVQKADHTTIPEADTQTHEAVISSADEVIAQEVHKVVTQNVENCLPPSAEKNVEAALIQKDEEVVMPEENDSPDNDSDLALLHNFVRRARSKAKPTGVAKVLATLSGMGQSNQSVKRRCESMGSTTSSTGSPISKVETDAATTSSRMPLGEKDSNMSPSPSKKRKFKDAEDVSLSNKNGRLVKPDLDDTMPPKPKKRRKGMEIETDDVLNPEMDQSQVLTQRPARGLRRSKRVATNKPVEAVAASGPSKIPLRLPGSSGGMMQDEDLLVSVTGLMSRKAEKDLATETRANTRKNKGVAVPPHAVLAGMQESSDVFAAAVAATSPEPVAAATATTTKRSLDVKAVHWDATLVRIQGEDGEVVAVEVEERNTEEEEEDEKMPSPPQMRSLAGSRRPKNPVADQLEEDKPEPEPEKEKEKEKQPKKDKKELAAPRARPSRVRQPVVTAAAVTKPATGPALTPGKRSLPTPSRAIKPGAVGVRTMPGASTPAKSAARAGGTGARLGMVGNGTPAPKRKGRGVGVR